MLVDGSTELDGLHIVIVGGILNFAADPPSTSLSIFSVLREVFAVPFSVGVSMLFFRSFFFTELFNATSFEVSEQEASDASAASAADARAPKGSLITSLGVMYITADGAISVLSLLLPFSMVYTML